MYFLWNLNPNYFNNDGNIPGLSRLQYYYIYDNVQHDVMYKGWENEA